MELKEVFFDEWKLLYAQFDREYVTLNYFDIFLFLFYSLGADFMILIITINSCHIAYTAFFC